MENAINQRYQEETRRRSQQYKASQLVRQRNATREGRSSCIRLNYRYKLIFMSQPLPGLVRMARNHVKHLSVRRAGSDNGADLLSVRV